MSLASYIYKQINLEEQIKEAASPNHTSRVAAQEF